MKANIGSTDIQSLIGQTTASEYDFQEQERELMLVDAEDFEGYAEWSAGLESEAWLGAAEFNGILIKRGCEHTQCGHFQCSGSTRIGGIEI